MSSNKNRQATCGDIQPAIPTATQGWTARTQQRNRPMRRVIALAGRTCWEAVQETGWECSHRHTRNGEGVMVVCWSVEINRERPARENYVFILKLDSLRNGLELERLDVSFVIHTLF